MSIAPLIAHQGFAAPFSGIHEWMGAPTLHSPEHYAFPKYTLTGSFGKTEAEEVAARIVTICQNQGMWVTIDYDFLRRMVLDELNAGQIQSGEVTSLFAAEGLRTGTGPEDWITSMLAIGVRYLQEGNYVVIANPKKGYASMMLITPTPRFFGVLTAFSA